MQDNPILTREKPLSMPANITLERQLWAGFGIKDGIITGVVCAIATLLAIGAYYFFQVNEVFCTFSVFGVIALCVVILQKVQYNLSIVDYIAIMLRYYRSQKKYYFRYQIAKESGPSGNEKSRR